MCTNPHYIAHPSLNRELQHHDIDTMVILGESYPFTKLSQVFKYLREHGDELPKDSEIVKQSCYLVDSNSGDTLPLFFACPCGRCDACKVSKYSEIASRLQFEAISYPPESRIIFFTLTYADWSLPHNGVRKSNVTRFIANLHTYCSRAGLPDGFRTFIVSEYGTDPRYTHRPHYHGLIFGLDLNNYGDIKKFNRAFKKAWTFTRKGKLVSRGRVEWEFARSNHGVSRYVTKYVIKGLHNEFVPYGKRSNFISFPRRSGGLGVNALKNPEILDKILNSTDGSITVKSFVWTNGTQCLSTQRIRIPRFIIDKLFPTFSRYMPANIQRVVQWCTEIVSVFKFAGLDQSLRTYDFTKFNELNLYFSRYSRPKVFSASTTYDQHCSDTLDEFGDIHHTHFGKMLVTSEDPFNEMGHILYVLLEYLNNFKFSLQDTLNLSNARKNYMLQIDNKQHISSLSRQGEKFSFISSCLSDSALDCVLMQ